MKIRGMNLTLTAALALTALTFAGPANAGYLKQINVHNFSAISVTGGLRVVLQYHPDRRPSVQETGYGIVNIRVSVTNDTLSITAPSGKMRRHLPQVVVSLAQPLRSLSVEGIADVSGNHLRSKQLTLSAKGPGRIALTGNLHTSQIWQTGGGLINLRGVRANDLQVKLSQLATTRLAGSANFLTARLLNSSTLEAGKLVTNTIFVKTTDNAVARVFPIENLRAFASGSSQIFYYHSPRNITEDAKQSANILQLGWNRAPCTPNF